MSKQNQVYVILMLGEQIKNKTLNFKNQALWKNHKVLYDTLLVFFFFQKIDNLM